ncbi:MAG: T9SS type A sorting domain-containing protein [Chitinophagaceae bacterium]
MRKVYVLVAMLLLGTVSYSQLVTFDFAGIGGGEATANSNTNATGVQPSVISRGSGVAAGANGDRFNSTGWATAAAVDVNDYVEFTITPQANYTLDITSVLVLHQRSGTGPVSFVIRTSLNSYATDATNVVTIADVTATQTSTFTFLSAINTTSAVTLRLYGYSSEGAAGSWGPGDGAGNDIVVNGTATLNSSNSNTSDIIYNTGFTAPVNVNYAAFQATDITDVNSVEAAQFTIRDGGAAADADGLGTILNSITMSLSGNALIRRVALYDGVTELAEVASGASVTFSGLTLTAPDNGSKTFSVRVTYNSTVTDNLQYLFTVTSATPDIAGSIFASANAGGAASSVAGDDNRIEVTADRLAFVQNTTTPTGTNVAMAPAPSVTANDINANRDLDFIANIDITSTGTLLVTPVTVAAIAGLATFAAITHTVAGTGFQLTAASGILTSATSNLFDIQVPSSPTDHFRSVGTGNWGTAATWESSADNIVWIPATLVPDANANIITVRTGHVVTVAVAAGGDQVVVESGATLTLNAAFTLADGADATDMNVNGTVINTAGTHVITGVLSFNGNSLYQHNRNGGTLLSATWALTSTAEIIGNTTATSLTAGANQSFGNFVWNSTSQTASLNLVGLLSTVNGNFRVQSTGTGLLRLTGTADLNMTVTGNFIVEDDLDIDNNGTGVCNINVGGNFSHTGGVFSSTVDVATITLTGVAKTFTQSGGTYTGTNINWIVGPGASVTLLNNLPISTGRSVTINGTLDATTLQITGAGAVAINGTLRSSNVNGIGATGTLANAGAITLGAASVVEFNAAGAETFTGRADYANVIINGGGEKTLNGNAILSGNLTLTSGKVVLGANNLTVGGAINGATSSNYIVTDGNGTLTLNNIGAGAVTFPVGPSNALYHPATISNIGTADNFSVRVASADPACAPGQYAVNATWDIAEAVGGGSDCAITLDFTGATTGVAYTAASAQMIHCTGAVADYHSGSVTGTVASGSGFTTFSPFGVSGDPVVLPVKFGNVRAYQQGNNIKVEWSNLTEANVSGYTVERSTDGINFTAMGATVAAARNDGGVANYSALDLSPANGINLYRIRSLEFDGKVLYSAIVKVNIKDGAADLVLYPNPVTGGQLSMQVTSLPKGTYALRIFNAGGQQVQSQVIIHNGGAAAQVIQLPQAAKSGLYSLQLSSGDMKLTKTFIVR